MITIIMIERTPQVEYSPKEKQEFQKFLNDVEAIKRGTYTEQQIEKAAAKPLEQVKSDIKFEIGQIPSRMDYLLKSDYSEDAVNNLLRHVETLKSDLEALRSNFLNKGER